MILPGFFYQIDSFVALSRGNDTIEIVYLFPYDVDPGNYEVWDKVGQGVGNLKSLALLKPCINNRFDEANWEILARILPHIQNKIELNIFGGRIEGTEEMRAFARTIQGHPAITRFDTSTSGFSFETTATLCSALKPPLPYVLLWPLSRILNLLFCCINDWAEKTYQLFSPPRA
jgi:hypothetical protein